MTCEPAPVGDRCINRWHIMSFTGKHYVTTLQADKNLEPVTSVCYGWSQQHNISE